MKKIYAHILVACAVLPGVFSCKPAEYQPLEAQAYIAQTLTNAYASQPLTLGNDEDTHSVISVGLSQPAKEDATYTLKYDPSVLEAYNNRAETSYEAYPENLFSLAETEVTIAKGASASKGVDVTVKPMTSEMKSSGKKYALPFSLESKDGKTAVLASGRGFVYILDRVVVQPVALFNSRNNLQLDMTQTFALTDWTIEMCVNMSRLGEGVGRMNNQAILGNWGEGSEIYIRFGDAPIDGRCLQIKTQGTQMNSNMFFNANTWYHIAFVVSGGGTKLTLYVNGEVDNSMDLPGKVTNTGAIFSLGNKDYLKADVMMGELRFWTLARSQAQIQNNMYVCDPKTNGLEGYWKMDEGEGDVLADVTGHGHNGRAQNGAHITWVPDVRLDGKK